MRRPDFKTRLVGTLEKVQIDKKAENFWQKVQAAVVYVT